MTQSSKYKMRISLNVLNHLGINLYSNIPAVLSEIIANAWDANASRVDIKIDEDKNNPTITITDNGTGMTVTEINERFLYVGYKRRDNQDQPGDRLPMGRKGIGKLSMFSIADIIKIYTIKNEEQNSFELNADEIRNKISQNKESDYEPSEIPFISDYSDFKDNGTRIVLENLKKRMISTTPAAVRKQIARRFGISCFNQMEVFFNDEQITIKDRDYFSKFEYLFEYKNGCPGERFPQLAENGRKKQDYRFAHDGKEYEVSGWIAMTKSSKDLKISNEENINKISIFVREKVAVEDVLQHLGFSGMFTRYVIGEIHADFLDYPEEDIAISNRQGIVEDKPKYKALMEFLRDELKNARDTKDNDKSQTGENEVINLFPKIQPWLDNMGPDTRKKAGSFFGKINKLSIEDGKKTLFKHGIQAFESHRLRDKLSDLIEINTENLQGFLSIAHDLDDLEASYYYTITQERLAVIEKFESIVDMNAKEKVLQEYIFKHLWLLDPSWDRATTPSKETTVPKLFSNITATLSDEEKRGRIDIQYCTTANVHVIVELKRSSVSVHHADLQKQVERYYDALNQYLQKSYNGKSTPSIEVVCVVGKWPKGWEYPDKAKRGREALKAENIRVLTYQYLIDDAKRAYKDYLDKQTEHGKFVSMLADLDDTEEDSNN